MKISILYEPDCPNFEQARAEVESLCRQENLDFSIEMVDTSSKNCPSELRNFGSPSVLVDGQEVDAASDAGKCCRIYRGSGGQLQGFPSRQSILDAIQRSRDVSSGTH
ncbi:MAG: hypothetical protein RH862_18695 [Leptospiraceae bacterium]